MWRGSPVNPLFLVLGHLLYAGERDKSSSSANMYCCWDQNRSFDRQEFERNKALNSFMLSSIGY